MANFHRYHAPTWLGAVPISPGTTLPTAQPTGKNYIYFNVNDGGVPLNGGAQAYGQVNNGPNQYTFMVGLREDATSFAINRGLKALAENTDYLDELLNQDRIQIKATPFSLSATSTTIPLPEDAYLGPPSTALNGPILRNLFRILRSDGTELVDDLTNTTVHVQSCSIATSPNPPYAGAGETLTTNLEVPGTTTYYLLHYTRSSFALGGRDLLRSPYLLSCVSVPGIIQKLFKDIKGDTFDWDGDPPTSLYTLTVRGLDGLYRNLPVVPAPNLLIAPFYPNYGDISTPGAGAFYHRTGPSILGLSNTDLVGTTPLRDPFGAIWTAYVADNGPGTGVNVHDYLAGSRGFVYLSRRPRSSNNGEISWAPSFGGFSAYTEHTDSASIPSGLLTKVTIPSACTLQKSAGLNIITLNNYPTDWFSKVVSGVNRTALVRGWTLVEVEWTNPNDPIASSIPQRRFYRISSISADQLVVRAMDGSPASFPEAPSSASGNITRIFTPTFEVLDGLAEMQYKKGNSFSSVMESGSMVCVALPKLTIALVDQVPIADAAYFGASSNTENDVAISWGGFESNIGSPDPAQYRKHGFLLGDGSFRVPSGEVTGTLTCNTFSGTNLQVANAQIGDLTVAGLSSLQSTIVTALQGDSGSFDTLQLRRVRKNTTTILVGGLAVTIDMVTALTNSNMVLVEFDSVTTIQRVIFPSFVDNHTFDLVFVHTSDYGQMLDYSGVWPSGCKFEDPNDAMLSAAPGWADHYTCQKSGSSILMRVSRHQIS